MKHEQSAPAGYRPRFAGTWTAIARECEYIVLAEDMPEAGKP